MHTLWSRRQRKKKWKLMQITQMYLYVYMYICIPIRQHSSAYVSTRQHLPHHRPQQRHSHSACMGPSATSVWGLKLLVYKALSY